MKVTWLAGFLALALVGQAYAEGLGAPAICNAAQGGLRFLGTEAGGLTEEIVVPPEDLLLFGGGRFQAALLFYLDGREEGILAHAVQLTPSSGAFYFFDPENVEMLIKVLDACAINDRFWVFFAATTNVKFSLNVKDVARDTVFVYGNEAHHLADPVADTANLLCR